MGIGLFARNNVTPATFAFDIAAESQINHVGPYKVSLVGWTFLADPLAGFLVFDMVHRTPNPNGGTPVDRGSALITGAINLADGTSYFSTAQDCLVRESGSSLWTLNAVLVGIAGSSKAGYSFIVEPIEVSDYSNIGAGVSP